MSATSRLSGDTLTRYWSGLSERGIDRDDDGMSLVIYAGMPAWFNRFYDIYQRKAFERLVAGEDFSGARVLDLGTGVGRWARRFAAAGASVVGIDLEPMRLEAARRYGGGIEYLEMSADNLAFPDESFDVVNSITVLQHVDYDHKPAAIAELARVLRPGGRAVVFELTDTTDDAAHVFAWPDRRWLSEFAKHGLRPRRTVGDQYAPILRAMKAAYTLTRGRKAQGEIGTMKQGERGVASRFMLPLRLGVLASYPVEEAARFLPRAFGRASGYLLVKD